MSPVRRNWAYVRSGSDAKPATGESDQGGEEKSRKIPAELKAAFAEVRGLESCFSDLAPYKQREYAEFVGGAKREGTRSNRPDKVVPMILAGKGMNDKYRP